MKLFQQLLVAGSALSMIAPICVQASELNLKGINSYASNKSNSSSNKRINIKSFSNEVATLKKTDSSSENKIYNFEAGSFSETTTMSGSATFEVGSVENGAFSSDKTTFTYSYDIDLNTTFTGDDNLYVGIETGNSPDSVDFAVDGFFDGDDALFITSMFYSFPLGNYEVAVGPLLDSDDLMPTTTSKYSDSFFFGSQYGLASNFFASQGTGGGLAVARTFDSGFNASGSIIGTGASTTSGILTEEGIDVLTLSLGYDADNYGGGIVYQSSDSLCNLADGFSNNVCNDLGVAAVVDEGYSSTTLGAYYSPGDKTTLSATSSIMDASVSGLDIDTIADFQLAIDRQFSNGTLSASWKTFPFYKITDLNGTEISGDDLGSFIELYYNYNVNDSLEITPGIAFTMPSHDSADIQAGDDDLAFSLLDRTAIGVAATFKF